MNIRGQSHVVGVALMLGLAVVALGGLTMGVGNVLDSQAGNADAERVATAFDETLNVERTGYHSRQIVFGEGTLRTEQRTLRVLDANGTAIQNHSIDVLLFENGDRRVAALGGAVVRGTSDNTWLVSPPSITSSEVTEALVIGVPVLGDETGSVSGTGGVRTTLRTNVSHTDLDLPRGEYSVAIETETPDTFERYFEDQNATVTRHTFGDDETESVVVSYHGERDAYVVVHDISLEVGNV